jgi:ribokinase
MSPAVVVVGSANLDLVAMVQRLAGPGETVLADGYFEAPGGKGLNQAVAAARLGATVGFIGVLGDDAAGQTLRAVMTEAGVDIGALACGSLPTGRALISVAANGENSIVVVSGANGELGVDHITVNGGLIGAAKVVLAQLEVPQVAIRDAFAVARATGAITVLNPAPAAAIDPEVLALTDILVPNEHEAKALGGVEVLRRFGLSAIVITEGSAGSRLIQGYDERRIAPFAVAAVDTVAAGDAFCGALCARLAAGDRLAEALRWASATGALATTKAGAVPSLPYLNDVIRLMGSAPA